MQIEKCSRSTWNTRKAGKKVRRWQKHGKDCSESKKWRMNWSCEEEKEGCVVFKSHYSYNLYRLLLIVYCSWSFMLLSPLNHFYFVFELYMFFLVFLWAFLSTSVMFDSKSLVFLLPVCFTQLPFCIYLLPLFFVFFV